MSVVEYAVTDRVGRITLNRPDCGDGINRELISELERCVERADRWTRRYSEPPRSRRVGDPMVDHAMMSRNVRGFAGS